MTSRIKNLNKREKITDFIYSYIDFLEKIDKNVGFSYHDNYGYLNSLPSNLGRNLINIRISNIF